jgi:hypothetical protein
MSAIRLRKSIPVSIFAISLAILTGFFVSNQKTSSAATVTSSSPIRAAFYYPWFPETWHSTDKYTPTLGQYDSSNQTILATHVAEAKYAGLDAFISSWWGKGTPTDTRLSLLLNAAAAQGFHVTPYYEKEGSANTSSSEIASDLSRLSSLTSNPGWLKVNNKPVLFIYNAASTTSTCSEVTKWKTATAGNWYLDMKVFSGYTKCADQPDAWHQYGPASAIQNHLPYSSVISPGFYKYSESSPHLIRDLTRFKQNLTSQITSGAQWALITSFNEWGEGSAVEPATQWQSASGFGDYLDAMKAVYVDGQRFTTTSSSSATTTKPSTSSAVPTTSAPSSSSVVQSSTPVSTSVQPSVTPTPTPTTSTPSATNITKVLTIVEENHSLNEMKASMPYLFGLSQQYAYATDYKAIRHPSEPNYLAIAGGSTFGDTADHNPAFQVNGTSIFGQAISKGKTAKSYEESMSSNCQQSDGSNNGKYAVKHNPWASFTQERTNCNSFDVPLGILTSGNLLNDINSGQLPNAGFITPNLCNDAHDCSLTTADNWLKGWLPKIMAGSDFTTGHLAIVVTADEDDSSQSNTVLTTVITKSLNGAHKVVTTSLNHYSLTGFYNQVDGGAYLLNASTAPNFKAAFGLN